MTAEPFLPIPLDPPAGALVETSSLPSSSAGPGAHGVSTSASANPAASAAAVPPDALLFNEPDSHPVMAGELGSLVFHCRPCLLEWDEPFCDVCGATLTPKEKR